MKMIIGPEGSGKTEKCFNFALANDAYILCSNKRAFEKKAKKKGYNDLQFVEIADLKNLKVNAKVVVDEAAKLFADYLERAFSVDVICESFTVKE